MKAREIDFDIEEESTFLHPFYYLEGEDEDDVCWRRMSAAEGYTVLGMYAEAHRELDIVSGERGFEFEAEVRRLDVYLEEGRWDQAAVSGEIVTEFLPERVQGFFKYATALHQLGRTAEAVDVLWLAPDRLERDPDYHFQLAGYEEALGNRNAALAHLTNALALKPELWPMAITDARLAPLVAQVPASPSFIPVRPVFVEEESMVVPFGDDEPFDCPF